MDAYFDQLWLGLVDNNQWGSTMCADLRGLVRDLLGYWFKCDRDLLYVLNSRHKVECRYCPGNYETACCLVHVTNQDRYDLCWLAVQRDPWALMYMKHCNQTKEICLKAVQADKCLLHFVAPKWVITLNGNGLL